MLLCTILMNALEDEMNAKKQRETYNIATGKEKKLFNRRMKSQINDGFDCYTKKKKVIH